MRYPKGFDAGPLSGGDKYRDEGTGGGGVNRSLEDVRFGFPVRSLYSKGKLTVGVPRRGQG